MIKSLIKSFLILLILFYKQFISIFLRDACRFSPTCSVYAIESIKKHPLYYSFYLIIKRIFSCHPFHNKTGYDPVP